MGTTFSKTFAVMLVVLGSTTAVTAQTVTPQPGETFIPTIWVDPDGCEHWVMDDGVEGYMTPHVTRDGRPVCNRSAACLVQNSDQLFASGSAVLNDAAKQNLTSFFAAQAGSSYVITGHTDSVGDTAYNQNLGQARANAVAEIARASGATSVVANSLGESAPIASNDTVEGRAENRRVEIQCSATASGGKL